MSEDWHHCYSANCPNCGSNSVSFAGLAGDLCHWSCDWCGCKYNTGAYQPEIIDFDEPEPEITVTIDDDQDENTLFGREYNQDLAELIGRIEAIEVIDDETGEVSQDANAQVDALLDELQSRFPQAYERYREQMSGIAASADNIDLPEALDMDPWEAAKLHLDQAPADCQCAICTYGTDEYIRIFHPSEY